MREFKYGVGVIAPKFLFNLLLVKMPKNLQQRLIFGVKTKKICPATVFEVQTTVQPQIISHLLLG